MYRLIFPLLQIQNFWNRNAKLLNNEHVESEFLAIGRPKWVKILERNFMHHWCKVPKCQRSGTLHSAECHPALRTRWVKFKNFDLERAFCFGILHQWCVKFLSRIFYPFWPPYSQKFQFGTFNRSATSWYFWLWCDQKLCSVLSIMVRVFLHLETLTSGATNGGIKKGGKIAKELFVLANKQDWKKQKTK